MSDHASDTSIASASHTSTANAPVPLEDKDIVRPQVNARHLATCIRKYKGRNVRIVGLLKAVGADRAVLYASDNGAIVVCGNVKHLHDFVNKRIEVTGEVVNAKTVRYVSHWEILTEAGQPEMPMSMINEVVEATIRFQGRIFAA